MIKTLQANVDPGLNQPAHNARLTIDGEGQEDIQAVYLVMDAATMQPVSFTVRHLRIIDGLPFTAEETHAVRAVSLTIKYEESE